MIDCMFPSNECCLTSMCKLWNGEIDECMWPEFKERGKEDPVLKSKIERIEYLFDRLDKIADEIKDADPLDATRKMIDLLLDEKLVGKKIKNREEKIDELAKGLVDTFYSAMATPKEIVDVAIPLVINDLLKDVFDD